MRYFFSSTTISLAIVLGNDQNFKGVLKTEQSAIIDITGFWKHDSDGINLSFIVTWSRKNCSSDHWTAFFGVIENNSLKLLWHSACKATGSHCTVPGGEVLLPSTDAYIHDPFENIYVSPYQTTGIADSLANRSSYN